MSNLNVETHIQTNSRIEQEKQESNTDPDTPDPFGEMGLSKGKLLGCYLLALSLTAFIYSAVYGTSSVAYEYLSGGVKISPGQVLGWAGFIWMTSVL